MSQNSPHIKRRYMQPLPSRRKHVLLVACTLAVIIGTTFIITNFMGRVDDARSAGVIAISPPPQPPVFDTLEANSGNLPDLLAGEVNENVNPTNSLAVTNTVPLATTDALGNPISSTPNSQNFDFSASPVTLTPSSSGQSVSTTGPRVITIDGKPIDGSSSALVPAPISGLTKISSYGQVPAISSTGVTPLSAYKRPFTPVSGTQTVSIIIGGLGVNRTLTQQAINELPAAVTLSFAAHSSGLQGWVNKARAKGHEVLIEIPMESNEFDASEPGASRALMATRNIRANPRNLDWLLSRAQGAFGVTNYNGDLFLNRADAVAPLLEKLAKTGIGFIFDGSTSAPSLSAIASSARLPYAAGYNLIDTQPDSQIIENELSRLTQSAKLGAQPIGVGFTYSETIVTVKRWANSLSSQGLTLAPASHNLR